MSRLITNQDNAWPTPSAAVPLDPRIVANAFLDELSDRDVTINALQLLMYFSHAQHLVEQGRPLFFGCFEAWRNGPVHPLVHDAFQTAKAEPIRFRAARVHPMTLATTPLPSLDDLVAISYVKRSAQRFREIPLQVLAALCMSPGAPWEYTVNEAKTDVVLDMQIGNNLITERFQMHKIVVGISVEWNDQDENTRFI